MKELNDYKPTIKRLERKTRRQYERKRDYVSSDSAAKDIKDENENPEDEKSDKDEQKNEPNLISVEPIFYSDNFNY